MVIQVAIKFKWSTDDNHQRGWSYQHDSHTNICHEPIWPAKPPSKQAVGHQMHVREVLSHQNPGGDIKLFCECKTGWPETLVDQHHSTAPQQPQHHSTRFSLLMSWAWRGDSPHQSKPIAKAKATWLLNQEQKQQGVGQAPRRCRAG
jgi:hypothetical protein